MNGSIREFLLPDLGEGLEDATITDWSVTVGDEVELNQPLCTVETNKAEVEIPSPYAGRIVELGGAAGETLPVGAVLVRIETSSAGADRDPVLVGYGADDAMDTSRRTPHRATGRPRAKPPVRRLAADLGVDLTAVAPGSGPDGVITRQDVLAAAGADGADAPAAPADAADVVEVGAVQAAMARRMTQSRREIPDAHGRVEVDCRALLELCAQLGERTVTPFVLTLRLLGIALQHHPNLNATWRDTDDGPRIHRHRAVHLGIAVSAPRGLLVPVVADAHRMTLPQLGAAVERLVDRARAGTLTPAELTGSTFTVSNFGALGLDDGVPVINYPEAAILGMGMIKPRPVVIDDAVVARPTMTLTCAFDHRVADGAQVAAFLDELRGLIESPSRALLFLR
ncbi:dihydrolipoamide acetyltransferase family protein [Mycolicibacterium thermoresistibile]|uniref:Dihydrolipoamide acetyltransferase component of pyruvate dehydrogenase complex n=2 Tax=Mycolicibacterium thermoresistibile TaxID=1797 RepID=G7CJE4_MYCT3|nr:dihydrolipoamide acetyltransferase family protein [Mycolicibacterium thermoresistibile]EHI12742.1 branched-chain alpha-keto acid dehydrogenase subunit E2 [Mycolicibacterium thermoresistibile ATCC 19527]MCV7190000.1 2-oxo acid dehydrogenase subunit E2 [Mycolicibacterium thermoresistibile]GAT13946.1 branched-chain alpha-keto acid dehydrogenase subunit E2 [Mycolicibacterium thermoresistibile]SNW19119.1 dihydrolipoamide S-acetyltransferase E2 component PdhC [Mycolicibacterium thermoresistibile]